MAGGQVITFASNAGASTSSQFSWHGGPATLIAEATWSGGNVQMQIISPHGTAINVGSTLTANGVLNFAQLPRGLYQIVITTSSAVYCSLISSPTYAT